MSEGSMLKAYSDHGSMRHTRPLTPAGVALTGSTLSCPSCEAPGALEGYRGNVQVQLCAVCLFGYGKQKEKPRGVVRKSVCNLTDESVEKIKTIIKVVKVSGKDRPQVLFDKGEVSEMKYHVSEMEKRQLKEQMKVFRKRHNLSAEGLAAALQASEIKRSFTVNAISVTLTPSNKTSRPLFDDYLRALDFAKKAAEQQKEMADTDHDGQDAQVSQSQGGEDTTDGQDAPDHSPAEPASDISLPAISETTTESGLTPIRPAAFTPTDPGLIAQHKLCDEWEKRTGRKAPVAGLVTQLSDDDSQAEAEAYSPTEDDLRGILDTRLETLIGCSIDEIQAVSKQLDVLIYARRMNIVATVKIPSHEVSL